MRTLYLVDGFALVFRAYYALIRHPLINSKQQNTGAVHNFFRMLLRFLRAEHPEELVVVFDARGKNFRHDLYPAYKANRAKAPEDLIAQLPWIRELVTLFGIPSVSMEGYEADDLIAAFARRAEGREIRILTGDKDLMQLVDDRVRILVPAQDPTALVDEFGPAEVRAKYGVPPEAIPDYLAIAGDSSDNLPGVPGIGEKGALQLLSKWQSLDAIYKNIDSVTPELLRRKLIAGEESARLSYRLARLDCDLPRPLAPEACRLGALQVDAALPRLRELELYKLMEELTAGSASKKAPEPAAASTADTASASSAALPKARPSRLSRKASRAHTGDQEVFAFAETEDDQIFPQAMDGLASSAECGCVFTLADTNEKLRQMIAELEAAGAFAFDSETTSLALHSAALLGLSFSCRERTGWYVPVGHKEASLPEEFVLQALKPLFENASVKKFGQNAKYDIAILSLRGITVAGLTLDTMIAAYLLEPGSRVNLDDLAARYLNRRTIRYEEVVPDRKSTLADAPLDAVLAYAAEDAEVCYSLAARLTPLLFEAKLELVLNTIELPLVPALAAMEISGIAYDGELLEASSRQLGERIAALERSIYAESGTEFNLNSPKQLADVLFGKLGLPPVKKTKTGYSTDEEVLAELAMRHEIARLLLEYRRSHKLKTTYLDVLPTLAHPATGRIHSSFNQAVTATGRLSSSDPNLQNIPVREEAGRMLRRAFVPAPGWVFIGADYSQIELRILAALSGDAALAAAYKSGEDIHKRTAAQIFGISEALVDRERRAAAKAINFGVVYGQSAFGLARELGISRTEATHFIDTWFEVYSGVRAFTADVILRAEKEGLVRTWFGRQRPIPELASANRNLRQLGERIALNTVIQGTAADLIKLAMIGVFSRLGAEGMRARLILQVHDELLVEAPDDEAERAKGILIKEMKKPWPFDLPLEVDVGCGQNWDEAH